MKVSLNKIRFAGEHYEVLDLVPDGVDELVKKIGAQLGAVEEVIDYSSKFDGVIIVKVVSSEKHPDADKLSICKVDDGKAVKDVERDDSGLVQVVCGAPNVHEGMLAAWLPPGATVPSTKNKEPFVLEARELRGVVSNGMLVSAKELGIGDSHDGLLEIDKDVAPGTTFAKAYQAEGEMIIDIENKMFTHRPDCFGILGVTREIAGIQHQPFKSPDWYVPNPVIPTPRSGSGAGSVEESSQGDLSTNARDDKGARLSLEVKNELPELVPRFTAITMSGVEIKPSPVWLQIVLSEVGIRPINNIVDYTNFWMLETGQPLHAYDYDKVKALSNSEAKLVIRNPKPGEKIKLLNGKEIEPRAEAIMIATDKQLIGIGGVMGGSETEVDESTKNIILECANFDMYSIRRTSMAHGLFTDAVTRFTKGQSPLQNLAVLAKTVESIQQDAKGKIASEPIDDNHLDKTVLERGSLYAPVKVSAGFINARLGLDLSPDEMKKLLENVEFKVTLSRHPEQGKARVSGSHGESAKSLQQEGEIPDQVRNDEMLTIIAPFWRTDIELREDIVEEVGRLYGYDHLPLKLPKRDLTPAPRDSMLELKSKIRNTLAKAGANEVLTYSFVHGDLLEKVGQNKSQAFQVSNALSPDLQYYRTSLTPSLLEKVHPNIKAGYSEFALFELGKKHQQGFEDQDSLPNESDVLAFVFATNGKSRTTPSAAPYYQAKKYLTSILDSLGYQARCSSIKDYNQDNLATPEWLKPYDSIRSSVVLIDDEAIGVVGEYKASVRKQLKLPSVCAGFELGLYYLKKRKETLDYIPLPRFPKVTQDITLKVPASLAYQAILDVIWSEFHKIQPKNTLPSLNPRDIFQRDEDKDHKQITFRLEIASYDRTLTDPEVNKLLDAIAAAAKTKYDAERV